MQRMRAGWGSRNLSYELATNTSRKSADGCSSGSPSSPLCPGTSPLLPVRSLIRTKETTDMAISLDDRVR